MDQRWIQRLFLQAIDESIELKNAVPISGGSINQAYRVTGHKSEFFLKCNKVHTELFAEEAKGLNLLRSSRTIQVPKTFEHGVYEGIGFLILEYIATSKTTSASQEKLGSNLAALHHNSNDLFGLTNDNHIGSLTQSNKQTDNWIDFFINERLLPQINLARSQQYLSVKHSNQFEVLFSELPNLIPLEPPSLLHGDLWGGNVIFGKDDSPYLIDPAVYFGHREMDLSFTYMFGGFQKEFYESYKSDYALAPGFEDRIAIHNLYTSLVHLNLFGTGYLPGIEQVLNLYSGR